MPLLALAAPDQRIAHLLRVLVDLALDIVDLGQDRNGRAQLVEASVENLPVCEQHALVGRVEAYAGAGSQVMNATSHKPAAPTTTLVEFERAVGPAA